MKISRLPLIFLMLAAALFLGACSGAISASSWPGLSADQNNAYIAHNQYVFSVRLSDGTMVWRFPEKAGTGFYATPSLSPDGKQLVVGGFDKVLYSLKTDSGQTNWTFNGSSDRWISGDLVSGTTIYAPSGDHSLYALDLTGKQLWKYTTGYSLWAQPAKDDQRLYQPSMDHFLYALSQDKGELIWKTDLGGAILGTPAMGPDGTLYVGTLSNEMFAVNSSDGKIVWRTPTTGGVWSGPVLQGKNLYFGDLSGNFYSMDTTGKIAWKIQPDGPITGSPLLIKSGLVFGTEAGTLDAVDFNGKILWNRPINGKLYTTPVLAGDKILVTPVSTEAALLFAFDQNGNQLWTFTPPK